MTIQLAFTSSDSKTHSICICAKLMFTLIFIFHRWVLPGKIQKCYLIIVPIIEYSLHSFRSRDRLNSGVRWIHRTETHARFARKMHGRRAQRNQVMSVRSCAVLAVLVMHMKWRVRPSYRETTNSWPFWGYSSWSYDKVQSAQSLFLSSGILIRSKYIADSVSGSLSIWHEWQILTLAWYWLNVVCQSCVAIANSSFVLLPVPASWVLTKESLKLSRERLTIISPRPSMRDEFVIYLDASSQKFIAVHRAEEVLKSLCMWYTALESIHNAEIQLMSYLKASVAQDLQPLCFNLTLQSMKAHWEPLLQ